MGVGIAPAPYFFQEELMAKKKLIANQGSDEVNVDSVSYKVSPVDHTVEVPEEVVGPLLERGGFSYAEPANAPEGFARMSHQFLESFSVDGAMFAPQEDGAFLIPVAVLRSALDHGFTIVE